MSNKRIVLVSLLPTSLKYYSQLSSFECPFVFSFHLSPLPFLFCAATVALQPPNGLTRSLQAASFPVAFLPRMAQGKGPVCGHNQSCLGSYGHNSQCSSTVKLVPSSCKTNSPIRFFLCLICLLLEQVQPCLTEELVIVFAVTVYSNHPWGPCCYMKTWSDFTFLAKALLCMSSN